MTEVIIEKNSELNLEVGDYIKNDDGHYIIAHVKVEDKAWYFSIDVETGEWDIRANSLDELSKHIQEWGEETKVIKKVKIKEL